MNDAAPEPTPWLLGPPPDPSAKFRFFCFPYAGAGASVFHGWQAALPAGVAVVAVQPPGRENRLREPAFTSMGPLVEAVAPALRPYLRPPFALFGHSLGALVAFELARRLRRDGAAGPARLFASGCRAPQLHEPPERPAHRLPREEFLLELQRLGGTPDAVLANRELLDLLLPTLRADFAVLETYRCHSERPLDCPITAVGGLEDRQADRGALTAWARQTTRNFRLHFLPGGHFFPRTERIRLLHLLQTSLAELTGASVS